MSGADWQTRGKIIQGSLGVGITQPALIKTVKPIIAQNKAVGLHELKSNASLLGHQQPAGLRSLSPRIIVNISKVRMTLFRHIRREFNVIKISVVAELELLQSSQSEKDELQREERERDRAAV